MVHRSCQALLGGRLQVYSFRNTEFKYVKVAQFVCGLSALIASVVNHEAHPGHDNSSSHMKFESDINQSVTATNTYQLALLMVGRFSAFSMYPVIILVMFAKYRATQAFLNKTSFSVFLIQNRHALHVFCGWSILIGSIIHTLSHCLRWIDQGNIHLLFTNPSGVTGVIVILSTCLIIFPMTFLRKIMNYEMRKCAHYFFWVFCIAMAFHAPFSAFPQAGYCCFVFPVLIGWYFVDANYVKLFMSERIDTVHYDAVKGGVNLTMIVSDRFENNIKGGYGYVMAPWISKFQWHPFSIYEDPDHARCRHMFIAKLGDWTSTMHEIMESAPSARPLWISGPFPSPYNDCMNHDNMIFVGAGAGITPAVSAIENYRESRTCNLIWAVRDVSMLVFFLEKTVLDEKAVNLIFYTGKEVLPESIENYNLLHDANIQIIKSRPDIKLLVPNIINYFENPSSEYNNFKRSNTMTRNDFSNSSPAVEDTSHTTPTSDVKPALSHEYVCDWSATTNSCESIDFEKVMKTCERLAASGAQSRPFNSLSRRSSTLVLLNQHHGRKTISIHEPEVAPNDPEEFNNNSVRMGLDASSIGHGQPKFWQEDIDARDYLENNFPKARRDTWGLLYCGGRNQILENLKQESKKLQIPLHEEVFDM